MKTGIKVIYGFDPRFKTRAIDKLLTYDELKLLRCSEIPYMAPELKEFAQKNGYKRLTEAWYKMPKTQREELKKKYKKEIEKQCNDYMSSRIEEDSVVRKILLKNNRIVDFNHTPKFYSVAGFTAPDMYLKNWDAYIVAYAEDSLIDNSVFSVVYIDNGKIKFRNFTVGEDGLAAAQKFWSALPSEAKTCQGLYCARVQGATFDIDSFKKTFKNNKIKVVVKDT